MKRTIIIICISLFAAAVPAMGQRWENSRHEVTLSFGVMPQISGSKDFPGQSWYHYGDLYDLYETRYDEVQVMPLLQAGYRRLLNRWINVGGSFSYTRVWGDLHDPIAGENIGSKRLSGLYLMPEVSGIWINRPHFKLYSSVGAGAGYIFGKDPGGSISRGTFAYEAVPVGIRCAGEVVFFMIEASVGNRNNGVNIGVGYRF